MKKIILGLIICLVLCVPAYADEYLKYTEPEISYNIQPAGVSIIFPTGITSDSVYCNGRLCVSLDAAANFLDGYITELAFAYKLTVGDKTVSLSTEQISNRPVAFLYNEKPYASLYEIITPFDYEMTVNTTSNSAYIKKYHNSALISKSDGEGTSAYIRLEDIAADGLKPMGTAKYTTGMLEKLKYTAEYLYLSGQQYYIAWIPVYNCPTLNYTNDISIYYNLYNSYFIYVLDYMTDHNGHLGLHGYTHQYGSDESGDGYEWGAATPYTKYEQQQRMILAKQAAARLGYKEEFFEFPHYEATNEQLLMAEHYFDVIYQNYPDILKSGKITYSERSGRAVYYVPTPAGYVKYKRDKSIYSGIDTCINNDSLLSFYFHPIIDEYNITISEYNNERFWCYSSDAELPSILAYIRNKGYNLNEFGF